MVASSQTILYCIVMLYFHYLVCTRFLKAISRYHSFLFKRIFSWF
eukprot:UN21915